MTRHPYIPDNLRQFDGVMTPADELENVRRANAMSADAKVLLILCGLSFAAGTLFGFWL